MAFLFNTYSNNSLLLINYILMTSQLIIYCLVIGLFGIAAQVLVKIISIKNKSKVGNSVFSLKSYFSDDWPTFALSLVFVGACILAADELLNWKPAIINYVKIAFFFVGYCGSDIITSIMSKAEKRIMSIIDKKTDIADGVVKP